MRIFWIGMVVGALGQATIGTLIGMNIDRFCKERGGCWFIYGSRTASQYRLMDND